jgi:hypothetical protein
MEEEAMSVTRPQLGGAARLVACCTAVFTVLACLAATQATASTVSYAVNRRVDAGSITGTIVTNGTIGSLGPADVIDWNLKIDADGNSATSGQLLGPLSGGNSSLVVGGPQRTATATGLFFDFGTGMMNVFQFHTTDYSVVWQLQAGIPFQDELIRESLNPLVQAYAFRGNVTQQIGSAVRTDTTPPTISGALADPSILWPPNHKMVDVTVDYDSTDDSGSVECTLGPIVCNETLDPAVSVMLDNHHVELRSERTGGGIGRIYMIPIICVDPSGNRSTRPVLVTVPHDQR